MLPVAIFSKFNAYGEQANRLANECTVGWTGAYPTLCRKRPTASLVSRKVLTPLLGQVLLCIIIQMVGFELVQRETWFAIGFRAGKRIVLMITRFIPPQLDTQKSNIKNSENTTLFLISCFQYIFSGVVLSVGPPFRQSMRNNCKLSAVVCGYLLTKLCSALRCHYCRDYPILCLHAIRPSDLACKTHGLDIHGSYFQDVRAHFSTRWFGVCVDS